jgi:hypothetical protein
MEYEWDEAKNRTNFAKHGLSFEDAPGRYSPGLASRSKTIVLLMGKNASSLWACWQGVW